MIRRLMVAAVIVSSFLAVPHTAHAASGPLSYQAACGTGGVADFLGMKSWDSCLGHNSSGAPELTSISDVWLIVLALLEDAIKIAGYTAAGFVIWGGVKYLKSQGDPGQINEARQVIYNALFGLLLAMISVAIVNLVSGAVK